MLDHVNQNKLTNRRQLKLLPSTKDQAYVVFYIYVVFIKDIKLRKCKLIRAFWLVFYCRKISFWPAKTSFQSVFADSRQLFRPLQTV